MVSSRSRRKNNLGTYVSDLEQRVRQIETPINQNANVFAGTIDSNSLAESIVLSNTSLQSEDYIEDISGWQISSSGTAEFSNVNVRGTIRATGGYIGGDDFGWSIDQSLISNTEVGLYAPDVRTVLTTASASFDSYTVTVADATGIAVGQSAIAAGISLGSYVTNVSGTTITISKKTKAALPSSISISSLAASSPSVGYVTYTTSTAHGLSIGDTFNVSGLNTAGYNGNFVATAVTATTVTAANATTGATTGTGLIKIVVSFAEYAFYAGSSTRELSEFKVDYLGHLVASSATMSGTISNNNTTISPDGSIAIGSTVSISPVGDMSLTGKLDVGYVRLFNPGAIFSGPNATAQTVWKQANYQLDPNGLRAGLNYRIINVTAATRNGTTATYTTSAAHGYIIGDFVRIYGIGGATSDSFNGLYRITAVTSTTFTVANTVAGTASIPSGNVITAVAASTPQTGTVTYTTTTAHGMTEGDSVFIAGITPAGYSGGYVVTEVPTSTTFRVFNGTTGAATLSGSSYAYVSTSNAGSAIDSDNILEVGALSTGGTGLRITGAISATGTITATGNLFGNNLVSSSGGLRITTRNDADYGVVGSSAGPIWLSIPDGATDYVAVIGGADVAGASSSGVFIIAQDHGGATPRNGAHLAFDANEIMAKATSTTTATLNLNADGGDVAVGALTTGSKILVNGFEVYHAGNDSTLVQTSGTQTIGGAKTFTSGIDVNATITGNDFYRASASNMTGYSTQAGWSGSTTGGTLGKYPASSLRYKENITSNFSNELDPRKLLDVQVVQFNYKPGIIGSGDNLERRTILGFIAEDFEEKYPSACLYDENEIPENVYDRSIIAGLTKLVQDLYVEIETIKARIQ